MKLVFATNNSNKIAEVSSLISNQTAIISLKDIGCNEDIVESEDTIIDNAILNANYIKKRKFCQKNTKFIKKCKILNLY